MDVGRLAVLAHDLAIIVPTMRYGGKVAPSVAMSRSWKLVWVGLTYLERRPGQGGLLSSVYSPSGNAAEDQGLCKSAYGRFQFLVHGHDAEQHFLLEFRPWGYECRYACSYGRAVEF